MALTAVIYNRVMWNEQLDDKSYLVNQLDFFLTSLLIIKPERFSLLPRLGKMLRHQVPVLHFDISIWDRAWLN